MRLFSTLPTALGFFIGLSLVLGLQGPEARANIGQEYGFGSRVAGLAGAGVAYGAGAFAAYHNPAALPFRGDKRLMLEVGFLNMNPSFTDINNIIIQNTHSSGDVSYGSVDNDYRSTLGTELGMAYRISPDFLNLTAGIAAFLPLNQVAYMDTGETFVPEYVMYRARAQRPQVELALGADLGDRFHVGVGLHFAFSLTSVGNVFLQADPGRSSTMRFTSSLKPKLSPVLGFLYTAPVETPDQAPRYTIGLAIRFPVASDNSMRLLTGTRLFGNLAALDLNFDAGSTLFYDPLSIELGTSFLILPQARTYTQIEFQGWGRFEAPMLAIKNPTVETCTGKTDSTPCGINVADSKNPVYSNRNVWVPRVAQDYQMGPWTLRAGYAYRASIFGEPPSGAGNYLDPDKHMFSIGAGYRFDRFLSFDVPCQVDAHLAYHHLVGQTIAKTPGDETGAGTGNQKIGAPGYDAGGKIWGGGVSLTLAL